jgi:hypothetical protein
MRRKYKTVAELAHSLIDDHTRDGVTDRAAALKIGVPIVYRIKPLALRLIREGLRRAIDAIATEGTLRAARPLQFGQLSLDFVAGIPPRFTLANGDPKDTPDLTKSEWRYVLDVRRRQLMQDNAIQSQLERVDAAFAPIWDARPDYTFGQVHAAWLGSQEQKRIASA